MATILPDTKTPALSLPLTDGGTFTLNGPAPENFTMLVFYRGHHCPVCKSYLEGLNGIVDDYRAAGFAVAAISMNDEETAKTSAAEWDVGKIPVAYGLTEDQARAWGLYISRSIKDGEADVFCEPGMFWVRPDGRLYMVDISNMPWARPDLAFLLTKIPMAVEKGYPARGNT